MIINYFCLLSCLNSISDLCSSCIINSLGFDFAFWTSLWADKYSGLLGNLFFNGFTYGNCVSSVWEYLILLGFYVSLPDKLFANVSTVWAFETFSCHHVGFKHKGNWNCDRAYPTGEKSNCISSDLVFRISCSYLCGHAVELSEQGDNSWINSIVVLYVVRLCF